MTCKNLILFIVIALIFTAVLWPAKRIQMPQLTNPTELAAGTGRLYIVEFPRIHIYKLPEITLTATVGREGEGPGEFLRYAHAVVVGNRLAVNSLGRLTIFTPDGEFVREIKSSEPRTQYRPLGKGFVGRREAFINRALHYIVGIYDEKLQTVHEIYREKGGLELDKIFNPLYNPAHFDVSGDRILVSTGDDRILVFDGGGRLLKTITHTFPKIRVAQEFKEALVENFKRGDRRQYEYLKDILTFPEFWPGIQWFEAVDGKIVVATHLEKEGGLQHLIFDADGQLLHERVLPLIEVEGEGHPYPSVLTNGYLYQVVEDNETGTWYLQVSEYDPF